MKKTLILVFIAIFGCAMQATNEKKNIKSVRIEFYKNSTDGDNQCSGDFIGFIWYIVGCLPCRSPDEASLYVMRLKKDCCGQGLMKPLAAFAIAHIFTTYPHINTITFFANKIAHVPTNTLVSMYSKLGFPYKKGDFIIKRDQFSSPLLKPMLEQKNPQVFKDMYVKIVDKKTGKQINLDESNDASNEVKAKL